MDLLQEILALVRDYRQYFFVISAVIVIRIIVISVYKRRKELKKKDNFIIGMNNVTFVAVGIWFFFFMLHILGITLKEFFTSITIIAAALAVVFRDYIVNGLNGMLFMFGDNLQIGDYIEVNDQKGQIEDLTLLNVHIKNDEDNTVFIPNNQIAAANVINYSKNPRHYNTIDFEIKSSNSISMEKLERILNGVLEKYQGHLRSDTKQLRVVEFKNDIIHYRFRFGLKKYEHATAKEIKQLLFREVLKLLEVDKNGDKDNS